MKKNCNTICPLPWMHSFVDSMGIYRLCCTSEETPSFLYDAQGQLIKADTQIESSEIMNSPLLKQVRKMMLNGEWPVWCERCQMDEQRGGESRRLISLQGKGDFKNFALATTLADGTLTTQTVTELDLRLGNQCNLRCRMCSPRSSQLCLKDWNDFVPAKQKLTSCEQEELKNASLYQNKNFISSLEKRLDTLETIHFAGGEPLLSPVMNDIINMVIAKGNAARMTLSYNTNFQVIPRDIWKLWEKFKKIKLLISIDGIGAVNDYIRLGSDWSKLEENFQLLHSFCEKFPQTEVLFATTVQAYNVLEIEKIDSYLMKFPLFLKLPIFINLTNPSYLSSSVLPKEIRQEAQTRAKDLYKRTENILPTHYEYLRKNILNVVRYLDNDDSDEFETFLTYTKKMDASFKVDTIKVLPFLKPYL